VQGNLQEILLKHLIELGYLNADAATGQEAVDRTFTMGDADGKAYEVRLWRPPNGQLTVTDIRLVYDIRRPEIKNYGENVRDKLRKRQDEENSSM
jgi:hypothetical protein